MTFGLWLDIYEFPLDKLPTTSGVGLTNQTAFRLQCIEKCM